MPKRFYLLIFAYLGQLTPCFGMQIREFFVELFKQDSVTTEYDAYRLLRENPLKQQVTYLAVPWAVLINTKQLHKVPLIRLQNAFTICQHIRYKDILPLLQKMGVNVLFTPHVLRAELGKKYYGVRIMPFPHCAANGIGANDKKDIFYSFIGYDNHPVRSELFGLRHPAGTVIIKRLQWHFNVTSTKVAESLERQKNEKMEYQDVMARTRYSLCPRGTGASTLRFWESLQAGAIPVLLSDDMSLPSGFDWSRCVVFIKESDVQQINTILSSITEQQENAMRQSCLEAFIKFSGDNFVSCVRDFFGLTPNKNYR